MEKSQESVRGIDAWRRFVDIPHSARHSCLFSVLISAALPSPHQSTRSLCFYRPSLPPHRSSLSSRVESRTCSTRVARFSKCHHRLSCFPIVLICLYPSPVWQPFHHGRAKKNFFFLQYFKVVVFFSFQPLNRGVSWRNSKAHIVGENSTNCDFYLVSIGNKTK